MGRSASRTDALARGSVILGVGPGGEHMKRDLFSYRPLKSSFQLFRTSFPRRVPRALPVLRPPGPCSQPRPTPLQHKSVNGQKLLWTCVQYSARLTPSTALSTLCSLKTVFQPPPIHYQPRIKTRKSDHLNLSKYPRILTPPHHAQPLLYPMNSQHPRRKTRRILQ